MKNLNIEKSSQLAEIEISYKSKVKPSERTKIKDSKQCYEIFKTLFNPDTIEHVESAVILLLNRANAVLGWCKISMGGLAGTVVDKKIIFQLALNANASAFILCHNHCSGNLTPSKSDETITANLDLKILDHLIITSESYFSFADDGRI